MKQHYHIQGMTCQGCENAVRKKLLSINAVETVTIDLATGKSVIQQKEIIPLEVLRQVLGTKYSISSLSLPPVPPQKIASTFKWSVYKPLFLIVAYILGTCILVQYPFDAFSSDLLMRHFMAGFFLVFSFFKLLNIKGFAHSYAMYDLVASRWHTWGLIYPFIELLLGILYLTNSFPVYTNWVTILVLGVSSIGVIQSNLNKATIKCACLGDVFNLPMSVITIIEDVVMVLMAMIMLYSL